MSLPTPKENQAAYYPDLQGKAVFISGGATGIGQALVTAFARQGARTAFVDLNRSAGETLEKALREEGCDVVFRACDITETKGYQSTIRQLAEVCGPFQVLINNAANDVRHSLDDLSVDRFDELISVNLRHSMFAAQAVAPMMRKAGGGSIINFGSMGWMIASPGYPVYATSKAAVHGMTRGLARDLGQDGIRVNTLVPGWVMTEKQKELWVDDAAREQIRKSQCLPGELLPENIAQMALFLASDASTMCTAQNFIVDGGWV
ncbi:SDR family NAD(P)-dependent oxidoreductase [Pokkaliibacter sp. CJK22405]|uniref:SDR family NAD(P)-dependent oxidoreductase n=1 Tax=Pokkaliibacter sp. CJK22405 TaxID=3384615 RepID=UPI0039855A2D